MTRDEIITAIGRIEGERAQLLAQLIAQQLVREPDDALLTVTQAAEVLSVTTDWLYRHADQFSFTVRPGPGQVRFSHRGVQEYLKRARND